MRSRRDNAMYASSMASRLLQFIKDVGNSIFAFRLPPPQPSRLRLCRHKLIRACCFFGSDQQPQIHCAENFPFYFTLVTRLFRFNARTAVAVLMNDYKALLPFTCTSSGFFARRPFIVHAKRTARRNAGRSILFNKQRINWKH